MKKCILSLVLLTNILQAHCLLFVHIGNPLPSYIQDCIAQARLFNPTCEMYLIANENALKERNEVMKNYNIQTVAVESLTLSDTHQEFLRKTAYAPGFWRYASERFLYIDDFMQQYGITDVFHIENDVMLYADLQELLPIIQKHYQGIAAVFDSDNRCIPSFIFIPHASLMHQLANCFTMHTGHEKNDMEIISLFKNSTSPDTIDHLPIIMTGYCEKHSLHNQIGQRTQNPKKFCNNFDAFNAIFDAAALGQYLGGTFFADKGPGFINETCLFNPSRLRFEWIADEQGRKIPYAIFKRQYCKILNLHIHSKQLNKFSSVN